MRKSILIAVLVLGLGTGLVGSSGVRDSQELQPYVTVGEIVGIDYDSVSGEFVLAVSYISGREPRYSEEMNAHLFFGVVPYLLEVPRLERCYGREAGEYMWDLLAGRTVWLEHYADITIVDTPVGAWPLLAWIYLDSQRTALFQSIMISQGFAKLKRGDHDRPPEGAEDLSGVMEQLEEEAMNASRGLWGACP